MSRKNEAMETRYKFVILASEGDESFAKICRDFGISRATGYQWLERYRTTGLTGLMDQSRRPRKSPFKTPPESVLEVVRLRTLKPAWGARRIQARMKKTFNGVIPSRVTIERILERSGLMSRKNS